MIKLHLIQEMVFLMELRVVRPVSMLTLIFKNYVHTGYVHTIKFISALYENS